MGKDKEKKLSSQTVQVRTAKEDQVPVPGREEDQDGFREEKSQRMNGNWTEQVRNGQVQGENVVPLQPQRWQYRCGLPVTHLPTGPETAFFTTED